MSLVERYARALGVWWGAGLVRPVPAKGGWRVFRWRDDGKGHRVAWGSSDGPEPDYREIDEPTALLFEHTLASGETLDVGLCGACRGDGVERTRHRPCPTCTVPGKPTGRDVRTLARLMVEAIEQVSGGEGFTIQHRGDPKAREQLATAADQLQDRGDPLGTWLALWLEGECPTCEGRGAVALDIHSSEVRAWVVTHAPLMWWHMRARRQEEGDWITATVTSSGGFAGVRRCPGCNGTGQALGTEQGAMERAAEADYLELTYAAIDPADYDRWFGTRYGRELKLAAGWAGRNLTMSEQMAAMSLWPGPADYDDARAKTRAYFADDAPRRLHLGHPPERRSP